MPQLRDRLTWIRPVRARHSPVLNCKADATSYRVGIPFRARGVKEPVMIERIGVAERFFMASLTLILQSGLCDFGLGDGPGTIHNSRGYTKPPPQARGVRLKRAVTDGGRP